MNIVQRAVRLARLHLDLSKLKRQADLLLDRPTELVSLVSEYGDSSLRALQIDEELANLVRDVRKLNPGAVLEIGTAKGGTLFLWARLARPDATIVSIDLPGGKFGGATRNIEDPFTNASPGRIKGSIFYGPVLMIVRLTRRRGNSLVRDKSTFSSSTATTPMKGSRRTGKCTFHWFVRAVWLSSMT